MWIIVGFFLVGFLVGNLAGLSATSVVTQVIGLFFALAGGSVIAFIKKLGPGDRETAGRALASIALGCLLGIYISIAVVQWQLLTPPGSPRSEQLLYLRTSSIKAINSINAQYNSDAITAKEAYEKIYKLTMEEAKNGTD